MLQAVLNNLNRQQKTYSWDMFSFVRSNEDLSVLICAPITVEHKYDSYKNNRGRLRC